MASDTECGRVNLSPDQEELLAGLRSQAIEGRTVLDIGCGTGRFHHRLLQEGAVSIIGVEMSGEYLEKAKQLARNLAHEDRVTYYAGDFLQLAERIAPADLAILDKVIHCYHDPEHLIRESAAHTGRILAITFPRNHWRIRWIIRIIGPLARWVLPFRVRFSRPEDVRGWLYESGFERVTNGESGMWHTETYVRRTETGTGKQKPQDEVLRR